MRILARARGLIDVSSLRTAARSNRNPHLDTAMNFLAKNEHPIERVVRVALGLGILSLVFTGPMTPWGYLGLVPLATGLLGSCPLYTLFGISTCKVRRPA